MKETYSQKVHTAYSVFMENTIKCPLKTQFAHMISVPSYGTGDYERLSNGDGQVYAKNKTVICDNCDNSPSRGKNLFLRREAERPLTRRWRRAVVRVFTC